MTFEMPECVDLCRSIVVATHSPGGFGGRAVALEVNHVTGFPEVFFPLRSLFFPLVKPTFRESTGKGAVILFNVFLHFFTVSFGPSSANPRSALSLVSSRCLAEEEAAESRVAEGIAQKHGGNSVKFGY